jgi:hypothetical protein
MRRVAGLALPLALICAGAARADYVFLANLTGDQVVPPSDTPAGGLGVCILDDAQSQLTVILTGFLLQGPIFASHIHNAPPGQNGFVVFGLVGAGFQNPVIKVWDDSQPFTRFTPYLPALWAGNLYFVIHTDAFSGGEVRGQIEPLDDPYINSPSIYLAPLDGSQQVPPVDTPAGGFGVALLDGSQTQVTVLLSAFGIASPIVASHIHQGAAGTNGLVVFPLTGGDFNNPVIRVWVDQFPYYLAPYLDDLQNGGLYFNVHSEDHSGGDVRGQIYSIDAFR